MSSVKVSLGLLLIMVNCSIGANIPNIIQKTDADTDPAKNLYKVVEFASYFFDKIMREEEEEREEEKVMEKTENVTQYIKITSSIEIPETETVKLVMEAIKVLWRAAMTALRKGFMPTFERVRREADSSRGGTEGE